MFNEIIEVIKEEFSTKELVIRAAALILAYPVGVTVGYVMERFGGM